MLGTSHTFAFSVDVAYLVRGYMRVPTVIQNTYLSQHLTAITAPVATYQLIVWPAEIAASTMSPTNVNRWGARVYRTGNFNGWTIRLRSGSAVALDLYNGGIGTSISLTSNVYVITQNTTILVVYSASTQPFSIEMYQ
jgi:hypothetical protein